MATSRICSIPGCDKPVHGHGYCIAHYERWRRYGAPQAGRTPNGEPLRFIEQVALPYSGDDCLIWPYGRFADGRAQMNVGGRPRRVSRVVCERAHGTPPDPAYHAAHSCGKGHLGCVNPHHPSWKTAKENGEDKVVHGTSNRGQKSPMAKLEVSHVLEIRALAGSISQRRIARLYGISHQHVTAIVRRECWEWV